MTKITEDMRAKLRAPLPSEAISKHPSKQYLSSIKAIYVTERMSDVFGVGGWRYSVEKVSEGENGMVVVKVTYKVPEYDVYFECFGGNDNGGTGNKNFDLGDAYKGATTDALTKIGSYLEIGIDVFKGKASTAGAPPEAKKYNDGGTGKCEKCGADKIMSAAGNIYCKDRCWTK
jgi:hypothetical protein